MDVVVLLKAVPTLDELAWDPATQRVDRERPTLLTNPLDARALTAVLAGRLPGERVTALGLGPPPARRVLENALQLGADRAVLLSDPSFAGVDVLGTARLLARALERIPHDLLVAGQFATDGRSGLTPSAVAALRNLPSVGPVRSIARSGPDRLDVVAETPRGTATWRVPVRSLLLVGERIGKPARVDPAASHPGDRAVEVWGAGALGEPLATHGPSPAAVLDTLVRDPIVRSPVVLRDLSPEVMAERAAELLRPRLTRSPEELLPPPGVPGTTAGRSVDALALVTDDEGELSEESLPLLSELRREGFHPGSAWIGRASAEDLERVARVGGRASFVAPVASPAIDPASAAQQLDRILTLSPDVRLLLLAGTDFGRQVAGRLAAGRGLGLVAEVDGLVREGDRIQWRKSTLGGTATSTVRCLTRPEIATVRRGAWRATEIVPAPAMGMRRLEVAPDPPGVERLAVVHDVPIAWRDLSARRTVVVIGRGLGGPERIPDLLPTLAAWEAGLAGTRKIVDAGWLAPELQVGLTGRTIAPELAVLVGVHGSPNHLVGLARAGTLLAIDPDPGAPVLEQVDVGLVGRWEEVLPPLSRAVAPLLRGRA